MTAAGRENPFSAAIAAARRESARLHVFRIAADTSTLIAVTGEQLEAFPGVTVDAVEDAATVRAALDAVAASDPEPGSRPVDARFGLVFLDGAGERTLSVYKGSFATRGQIGEQLCDFNDVALDDWLFARYPPPVFDSEE